MWYRVFALKPDMPQPAALQEHLRLLGVETSFEVRGDDLGWTALTLKLAENSSPLQVERYLPEEDDIRDDLDTWAAWLETQEHEPNHSRLMQHVIGTQQLFTLRGPLDDADEDLLERVCEGMAKFLAGTCEGIYQIDGRGFFAAAGTILLQEL
ncbi:MAG TPA: hypothetical protein VKS79_12565 [Gemmataceae bacterium]|nr:hypothetical protein [Gemmataceae bacterium]